MMILHGKYISSRTDEEYAFIVWAETEGQKHSIPQKLREHWEELGAEWNGDHVLLPRIRLSEGLQSIFHLSYGKSNELQYWLNILKITMELAAKEHVYPGLTAIQKAYYARWKIDTQEDTWHEQWDLILGEGSSYLHELDDPTSFLFSFVEDCLDSYIRYCINTRLSLRYSELGRLIKFKPFYLHEEWFYRLCLEDASVGEGRRWDELFQQYMQWRGKEEKNPDQPLAGRLCLRLEPPKAGEELWMIRYFWFAPNGNLLRWNALDKKQRHLFFTHLSEAAIVYPLLQARLNGFPDHCSLEMEEARLFLRQIAPQLRNLGYAVLAPKSMLTPLKRGLGLQIRMEVTPHANEFGLSTLIDYDFQVALGEQKITSSEWEKLLRGETPFIQFDGEWVELEREGLRKASEWIKNKGNKGHVTLRDALLFYAAMEDEELLPFHVQALETDHLVEHWFQFLQEGPPAEEFPLSPLFKGELRPYQRKGTSWLLHLRQWNMGGCLADDMGLGKTIQFLSYLVTCKDQGRLTKPFLLICPTSVLGNWHKELERFVPQLNVLIHYGSERETGEAFKTSTKRVDLVMTTYSLLQRDTELLTSVHWDGVVLDEAQHIKNPRTLQTRAVRRLTCNHRIALTGTPIENRLEELWSIFEFLNPAYLGSYSSFRREFIIPVEKQGDRQRLSTLKKFISPFFLRRSKSDPDIIKDLPQKIETKEYCYLSSEQAMLYEKIVRDLLNKEGEWKGIERKGQILSAITKLKQVCNHPALIEPVRPVSLELSGKLARMFDMLEEIRSKEDRILIFSQYRRMGEILQQLLEAYFKTKIPFLHGGVSQPRREEMINRFQDVDGPPVFLLSLKAGGVGLNLTQANHVIHFDRWWNPAVENQATDRAYRIGQTRTVYVHKFICVGTIEEKIDTLIERKKDLVEDVLGYGEGWITELTSEELRDLVSLRQHLVK